MIFKAFYYDDTGCAAYLFGCGGKARCAVVDPQERHVDLYASFAEARGMRITHVVDTHVHADHRSGGRALAADVGAAYCLHRSADVAFPFQPLDHGQTIELGNTLARVLHTPGHTPESICLLVSDLRRGPEPWFVVTGDTLFVGSVGRPDLPGDARRSAAELHGSLTRELLPLPGSIEVYPGHFAGSACGADLSGKPSTTIAFERRHNPLLGLDEEEFVAQVTSRLPRRPEGADGHLRYNQGRL